MRMPGLEWNSMFYACCTHDAIQYTVSIYPCRCESSARGAGYRSLHDLPAYASHLSSRSHILFPFCTQDQLQLAFRGSLSSIVIPTHLRTTMQPSHIFLTALLTFIPRTCVHRILLAESKIEERGEHIDVLEWACEHTCDIDLEAEAGEVADRTDLDGRVCFDDEAENVRFLGRILAPRRMAMADIVLCGCVDDRVVVGGC